MTSEERSAYMRAYMRAYRAAMPAYQKERIKQYRREYTRRVRAERKAAGLCSQCGKAPEPGNKLCRACQIKSVARNRAYCARQKRKEDAGNV